MDRTSRWTLGLSLAVISIVAVLGVLGEPRRSVGQVVDTRPLVVETPSSPAPDAVAPPTEGPAVDPVPVPPPVAPAVPVPAPPLDVDDDDDDDGGDDDD